MDYWVFNATFSNIFVVLVKSGNQCTQRNKLYALVVIVSNYLGRCKYNNNIITTSEIMLDYENSVGHMSNFLVWPAEMCSFDRCQSYVALILKFLYIFRHFQKVLT